jgi:hypothetical protein
MKAQIAEIVRTNGVSVGLGMAPGDRLPPRPEAQRQVDYLEKFDAETLWYDAFGTEHHKEILLIGPPLLNLLPWFTQAKIFGENAAITEPRIEELDRCARIRISSQAIIPNTYQLQGLGGMYPFEVGANHADWFEGRRVLVVKSKNNTLCWIRDWLEFHVKHHGADAVLFYDNASDEYTTEAVLGVMAAVEGIKTAVVVAWNYKFGPPGTPAGGWDSDFSQHGILEHARWRFLARASSVLSVDIDEWVLPIMGQSVFELSEKTTGGAIQFEGNWVYCCEEISGSVVRHQDHRYARKGSPKCPPKWCLVPKRIPASCQWTVHQITGHPSVLLNQKILSYRHFHGVSTSWKWERKSWHRFDPEMHFLDTTLNQLLNSR